MHAAVRVENAVDDGDYRKIRLGFIFQVFVFLKIYIIFNWAGFRWIFIG